MNIIWKKNLEKYANGDNAFSGKLKIGSINWNSITSTPKYKAYFIRDGFLAAAGAETEDECKKLVERAFEKYMKALGVVPQSDPIALLLAVEFGYKKCEKGENLDKALTDFKNLTNQ